MMKASFQPSSALRPAQGAPSSSRGERGIALVVVLLLMAVLSGLATGFAMTGQVEVQMGTNEVYYAGARAAAEAGLNRAIVEIAANSNTNFLSGTDGLVDSANAAASVNTDNGKLTFLLGGVAGPYPLGTLGQYSYDFQIYDDDNPLLYESLTTAQVQAQAASMLENNDTYVDANQRLILRATGYGPNGTTVRIGRVLQTVPSTSTTTTTTTALSNPAILVNGDLEINGNVDVMGTSGSVHTNGNLLKSGASGSISGDATATGTFTTTTENFHADGSQGGGRPTVNVPDIHAIDYIQYADYKLSSTGSVQTLVGTTWTDCTTSACTGTGWSYSSGTWSLGSSATAGTFYVEGKVSVSGSPNGGGSGKNATNLALSIIATGSISLTGSPKFTPENTAKIQFVTDGDLTMLGSGDYDDPTVVEGQIMVREQLEAGSVDFQGRILVQDVQGPNTDQTTNRIHGSGNFTYNGTLGAIETTTTTTTTGPTTYVNNVSGWMES